VRATLTIDAEVLRAVNVRAACLALAKVAAT